MLQLSYQAVQLDQIREGETMWIVAKNGYTYKVCYTKQEAVAYATRMETLQDYMGGVDQFTITFIPAE